ncbi:hypothetical protein C7B65_06980 [Phormidesmis priestleyi ULC007]|uniref:Uncharacterized protein n=2 Tax=Phormidesmis priestleyi TaxID=268141 RepID=A0A2T1DJI8_9CYAN|nr:hypothetical protein C7B65_06980 [Phormidesmis priestleyi ULC007]PZO54312.1 MAG: hypothetical protein DCF14_02625 [Phormidesmis priestleyi]
MDLQQQDARRAAARAFIESLDKLQETLCSDAGQVVTPEPEAVEEVVDHPSETPVEINLDTLEQAVADIERFMQAKKQD